MRTIGCVSAVAILTATSVGITARVFHDLGQLKTPEELKTPEAQIILGATVVDDVMGLTILAVVKATGPFLGRADLTASPYGLNLSIP